MESVVLRSNSGWGDLHIYEGSTLAALVLSPQRGGEGPTRRGGTDIREDNLMPSLEDWLFELYSQLFKYYSAGRRGGVEERQVFSRWHHRTSPPLASEYLLTNSTRPNHSKHKYGRTCLAACCLHVEAQHPRDNGPIRAQKWTG